MNLYDWLFILSVAIFLILLWISIGVRHFSIKKQEIQSQSAELALKLMKRADLVPLLIETVRSQSAAKAETIEKLIHYRARAMRSNSTAMEKIEFEHDLSGAINALTGLCFSNRDLAKDTGFLEVKKDIEEIEKAIHSATDAHNLSVRSFNKNLEKFYFWPIKIVFRYRAMDIFEFES